MDLITKLKLQEWSQDYANWKRSGMTKKKWCQDQGMPLSTFIYRNKRIRDEATKLMEAENRNAPACFAQVPDLAIKNNPPASQRPVIESSMVIELRNSSISVSNGVSDEKLKMVLEVLLNAE